MNNTTQSSFGELLDQQPPSCLDLEKKVIGSILLDPMQLDEVSLLITHHAFYDPAYREIYKTMLARYQNNQPLDLGLLRDELKKTSNIDKVGHTLSIAALSEPTKGYARHYAVQISEAFKRRSLIDAGKDVIQGAFDTTQPIEQVCAKSIDLVGQATEHGISDEIEPIGKHVSDLIEAIEAGKQSQLEAISTGISTLDDALNGGFHPSQSIVLAARPSIGKSMLALSFALHAAKQGTPVAFFSLEMSHEEIAERTLSNISRVSKSSFESAVKYRGAEINDAMYQISDLPLYVNDQAQTTVEDLVAKMRMLKRKHGIKLAIVDYLQLIEASDLRQPRQQQIGHISRRLKQAAQDVGIAIVSLSQLNREADDSRPALKHLREAGDIEQDANTVLLLWQEEGVEVDSQAEHCKLTIGKNRSGQRGNDIDLLFFKSECRFVEKTSHFSEADYSDRLEDFGDWNNFDSPC